MTRAAAERRQLGAYYSPSSVADVVTEWAIRSPYDRVLEPSFGGCEFLQSSLSRLQHLGCDFPSSQLSGCDVDPQAFIHLGARLGDFGDNFLLGNFLELDASAFDGKKFQAVVGNPPYVRHHNFSPVLTAAARRVKSRLLPNINSQASLWVYFVLHSTAFLEEGGRMAWLLPGSFLHADYSKCLHNFLQAHFNSVVSVRLRERLFRDKGADESTVIVLADGWSKLPHRPRGWHHAIAETVAQARLTLSGDETIRKPTSEDDELAAKLGDHSTPLGEYCDVQIGLVTGDAKFFLFNAAKAEKLGIGTRFLSPILSRGALAPGISLSRQDLNSAFKLGLPAKILNTSKGSSASVRRYLASMSEQSLSKNATFKKRSIWHCPIEAGAPDAFFTGMSHRFPRLILNVANVDCTNSLYRIQFKQHVSAAKKKMLCVSLISTFGQLSAEVYGRQYSAGMLKHEPRDVRAMRLLVPKSRAKLADTYRDIDALLRRGEVDGARLLADKFLIDNGALTNEDCQNLASSLVRRRNLRWLLK